MKALIFVRTSTEKQSTDDQKRELVEFCKSEGYDDIVCVERQGASAAKVDDEYREMVAEVKEKIESGRKKVEELGRKKERIIESYVDGVITRKDRDTRLLKVEDDVRDHLDTISLLQGKREGILGIFEKNIISLCFLLSNITLFFAKIIKK